MTLQGRERELRILRGFVHARTSGITTDPQRRAALLLLAARSAMLAGHLDAATVLVGRAHDEAAQPLQRAQAQHLISQLTILRLGVPYRETTGVIEGEANEHAGQAISMLADAAVAAKLGGDFVTVTDLTLLQFDQHQQFGALINPAIGRARAAVAVVPLASLLAVRAEGEFQAGQWQLAQGDAAEALALLPEGSLVAGFVHAITARMAAARGQSSGCRAAVRRALAVSEPGDVQSIRDRATAALADEAHAQGAYDRARQGYERIADHLDSIGGTPVFIDWLPPLVECCVRLGDLAGASRHTERVAAAARRLPTPTTRAFAAEARARLAGGGDYEPLFEEALAWHERGGRRFTQARTQLAYGERLRRHRRRREARPHLCHAIEVFEDLQAEPWVERARHELRATGETARARTAEARDVLTPHEVRIARLLRNGDTNRDIAVRLFISPKTVEKHITSIYRKLGVSSRRELWELRQ